ncbi:helix-turn-helix domain-containing protein [Enterococcus plantarum]|nr:winged helix-turn-helix domain-containing protein [Enterococcus plantarum]
MTYRKEEEDMLHLGIVGQTNLTDKWTHECKNNLYDLIEVKDKEQLAYLDGVVIPMETTEQLSQVIDWIVACRINPTVFIWVFSEVPLETEKKIMMSIGATDVIAMPETFTYLSMSVENTFVRLGHKYKEKSEKEEEAPQVIQLNELNQSLVVNEVEKELTRNEYKVLSLLYEKPNTTVLYSTIAKSLWPGKEFNISRIANIVCHIRNKIGKNDTCSIATIRSKGYMFRLNNS